MLARRQRTFEPRDGGRFRAHALRDLRLTETGRAPGGQHLIEQGEFFAVQTLVFLANFCVGQCTCAQLSL